MTAADIVSGRAASQRNFLRATLQLHTNRAPGEVLPTAILTNLPDFTGVVEVRQIAAAITPSDTLSAADQANGITYRGSVELTFVSRYGPAQNSVPTQYADDTASIAVTVQNRQITVATPVAAAQSLTGLRIFYPAHVFVSLEQCEKAGATNCT